MDQKVHTETEVPLNRRNRMIEKYLPIVRQTAREVCTALHGIAEYDDLYSTGIFGLIQAIEKYDCSQGIPFQLYCRSRIRGEMYDDLRRRDWIPRQMRKEHIQLRKAHEILYSQSNQNPTYEELADEMKVDSSKVQKMLGGSGIPKIVSLNQLVGDKDEDISLAELLSDRRETDPKDKHGVDECWQHMIRRLNRTEKLVMILYYREELTLSQIGTLLGISESRVCQIHHQSLDKLREEMATAACREPAEEEMLASAV